MRKATLLMIVFALSACDQSVQTPTAPVVGSDHLNSGSAPETGVVLETIDVESYTYLRLDNQGTEVWIASSPVQVSEGDVVRFSDAMLMKDFHSKALDRTFENILFVSHVEVAGAGTRDDTSSGQTSSPHSSGQYENMAAHNATGQESVAPEPINVAPLENGMTIASIFAEHEQLEGQVVSLRAKVVKFSPNILGKNWITLKDGTGTAPDDTLVVTSMDTVAVDDVVIVKGSIKSNVDIGAGYTYRVILEESSFE